MKSRSEWPAFCALCLDTIAGPPRQQPLGRDNAMVNVCTTCDSAHPRSGRYSFDDSKARAHEGVGDGNRRTSTRHAGPK